MFVKAGNKLSKGKLNGIAYRVTKISYNALKSHVKLKTLMIGKMLRQLEKVHSMDVNN